MIFYFTGTGNSLFAARRLLDTDERLIFIGDAIKNEEYEYTLSDNEKAGFVFPVYFYSVPSIVEEFISRLTIKNAGYVYALITCGGGIMQSGAVLKKMLNKRNIRLDYVSSLLMPDNSMLFYQIPSVDEAKSVLQNAEKRLLEIKEDLNSKKFKDAGSFTLISDLVALGYRLCNKTASFYVDDNCVGCGLCALNCPQNVIRMKEGRPEWVKPVCSKCSGCINRCPNKAIQYTKATIKRNRYINPEL